MMPHMIADAGYYLRNAWYVGAWAHEVGSHPLPRTLLNEPLVMYRTRSGTIAVLTDICPHRFAPLSSGKIVGDAIQCGYHGFTFAADGACVSIPGLKAVPPICVRSYPAIERWGWIYVWMGDPDQADDALLPEFHYMDDPHWRGSGETLHVEANYTLIRDNLLDLTHAKYVHGATLATDDVTEYPVKTDSHDRMVVARRTMDNIKRSSPFHHTITDFTDNVTHWQEIQYEVPDKILIRVGVKSAPGARENKAHELRVINALTPETSSTTHYFWHLSRNVRLDDRALDDYQFNANRSAFDEDKAIIEMQQKMIDRLSADVRPAAWPHDRGIMAAHQLLDKLIEAERAQP